MPAKPSAVDYTFLDAVVNGDKKDTLMDYHHHLGKQEVDFKVDTGAAVTAITEQTFQKLGTPPLSRPSQILCGPAQNCLEVQGVFKGQFAFQGKNAEENVYIVEGLKTNLLGCPTITALHLVEKLCYTELEGGKEIKKLYPKVLSGLGTFGERV